MLRGLDLDEESDKPIHVQIQEALSKQGARVMDLFREWDTDGDGEVSREEFRKAMPMLGLDVPRVAVDALFDSFDKDGGGSIDYKEMSKMLRAPSASIAVDKFKSASARSNRSKSVMPTSTTGVSSAVDKLKSATKRSSVSGDSSGNSASGRLSLSAVSSKAPAPPTAAAAPAAAAAVGELMARTSIVEETIAEE